MGATVHVSIPVNEIVSDLKKITLEQQERVATALATQIRKNLAVLTDVKTGNLRRSVKAMQSKFDAKVWIATVQAPHAHLIEYGHYIVARGTGRVGTFIRRSGKGGPRIGHVPARPFVAPAKAWAIARLDRLIDANFHIYIHKGVYTKGYKRR